MHVGRVEAPSWARGQSYQDLSVTILKMTHITPLAIVCHSTYWVRFMVLLMTWPTKACSINPIASNLCDLHSKGVEEECFYAVDLGSDSSSVWMLEVTRCIAAFTLQYLDI